MGGQRWTVENTEYLRNNWATKSIPELAQELGRTETGVHARAQKLGLCPRRETECPVKNYWLEWQDDYLRDNWRTQTTEELADAVGHPMASTRARCQKLGLITRKGFRGPDWRQEDIDQLEDLWGSYTIPQIAKRMGKTENAVKVKATRLGLGRYVDSSKYMTAMQVARMMHVDIHAVTDYWIPLGLKFTWKAPGGVRKFRYIDPKDLETFLQEHLDIWDSLRLEEYALGHEPEWLKAKRKADAARPRRSAKKWTQEEDSKLVSMFRIGKTYAEMGDALGRTGSSCEHRCQRLDVWGTGKYLGNDPGKERRERKQKNEKRILMLQLCNALKAFRNTMEWGEFWQKDSCQHWDPVRGCTKGCSDCDSCTEYQRIRPQYCKACGGEFLERATQTYCPRCRAMRKKQHQRKYAILRARGRI